MESVAEVSNDNIILMAGTNLFCWEKKGFITRGLQKDRPVSLETEDGRGVLCERG